MLQEVRQLLKNQYHIGDEARKQVVLITKDYLEALGDDRGIFISDHSIIRYIDRVLNLDVSMATSDNTTHNLYDICTHHNLVIEDLRDEMLSIRDDRTIIKNHLSLFRFTRGDKKYGFIVKELCVVTVINL